MSATGDRFLGRAVAAAAAVLVGATTLLPVAAGASAPPDDSTTTTSSTTSTSTTTTTSTTSTSIPATTEPEDTAPTSLPESSEPTESIPTDSTDSIPVESIEPAAAELMVLAAAIPPATCAVSITVRVGTVAYARCVETRLVELGYSTATPDDLFDSASAAAVSQFQLANGLSANGVADPSTLAAMGIWRDPGPATCAVSMTVRPTMVAYARCVETRLTQLGLVSAADDYFDWNSSWALGQFQLGAGLGQTGNADPTTLSRLGIWRDAGPGNCAVSIWVRPTMVAYARCVETRLAQLGLVSAVDDYFDWDSAWSLQQFQLSAGLPPTGVADPTTLARLGIWRDAGPATCAVSVWVRPTMVAYARCVETRLRQLGLVSVADDYFDWDSAWALQQFQLGAGLPQTRVADPTTLARLGLWRDAGPATCAVSVWVRPTMIAYSRCVETRLREFGLVSAVDDYFDWNSAWALQQFQLGVGLPETGVADPTTLAWLSLWRDAGPATCAVSTWVRPTMVAYARCVETRLREFGLISTVDDYFDGDSAWALGQFQLGVGLPQTGVADPTTLAWLSLWRDPGPVTCSVSASVSPGANGAWCVETRLRQLGFVAVADDYFDSSAVWALQQFQLGVGLPQTGVADPATLSRLGIWVPPPNPYPVPANSGSGRRVVYSRAQQRVWAVDAAGNLLTTHRVSGRTYEPYAGTYYVYSRSATTYSAKDPSVRWRYMVRFAYGPEGGRIGFHEIPNRNGVPLQTKEQLGLPLSGGCVRQSTADALWMWNWAPIGTKVVVL